MFNSTALKELKNSITFKVLKIVFSIYFLITCSVTCVHMYAEYANEKHGIQRELQLFQRTFELALADAIWNLDEDQVLSAMTGMLKSPVMVGVSISPVGPEHIDSWELGVVLDKNGINTYYGEELVENQTFLNSKLITHHFEIKYSGDSDEVLGNAILFSSNVVVLEKVKMGFIFILVNALIKTLALWYLFMWGGTKYLSKPLGEFTKSVQNVSLSNLNEIHVVEKNTEKNELNHLQDSFNQMTNNLKIAIDVQHKTQHSLELSEKYLQEVFNSMPTVLISVNVVGIITHWNKTADKLFGFTQEQAIGKKIDKILVQFQDQLHLVDKALSELSVQDIDKIKIVMGDEVRYFSMVVYPLELSQVGAVLRIDDISDKVLLENMVLQTEKMTSLGTLAAGMAHEINNPLGGILQGIQNVNRRLDPEHKKNIEVAEKYNIKLEDLQQYLHERNIDTFIDGVKDLGERAAAIVKNVLKFSRRSDTEMHPANVNDMITDMIQIISTDYDIKKQTNFKALEFLTELDDNVPEIICSGSEVEQVLLNLIKNAAHALGDVDRENPKITVRSKTYDKGVILEVEDNGCGIDEKTKEHLFEPFFTTKPVGIGTGLGLSISYYIIVDKHQGSLDVKSESGVGTTFIIKLPLAPSIKSSKSA